MNALMTDTAPSTALDAQPREPQGKMNAAQYQEVRNQIDARKKEDTPRIAPEDYKPEPIPLSESNHNWFGGKAFQFQLKPIVQQYYGPNRFFGYAGSAVYGEFVDYIDKKEAKNNIDSKKSSKPNNEQNTSKVEDIEAADLDGFYYKDGQKKSIKSIDKGDYGYNQKKDHDGQTTGEKRALQVEAILFTSLSAYYGYKDIQKVVEDNRSNLAIEFDKHPSNVNIIDAINSENTIISTQTNKWMWRNISHTGSGLAYLVNLPTALVASAINITMERFMLSNETAYEMTEKLINKVQLNHLDGEVTKETVVSSLQQIMQQMRVDHNFELITSKEFEVIRPVLNDIANDIIDKKANMSMVIEYLGAGNIIPGKLEQSQKNYEYSKQSLLERDPEMLENSTKSIHLRERAQFINGKIDYRSGGYPR